MERGPRDAPRGRLHVGERVAKLPRSGEEVYRENVSLRVGLVGVGLLAVGAAGAGSLLMGCQTVDPGPNYVVPNVNFDADYFFCYVEPQVIFAKKCGSGDSSLGDPSNGCHFNSSAVSGMALVDHPPVDCGGGDHPVDPTQVGAGSPPQSNLQAAALEMNRDYTTAPFYVRPTGNNHPRQVINPSSDQAIVNIIATWAQK
jgi:hypothetical protein